MDHRPGETSTDVLGAGEHALVQQFRLVVTDGPDAVGTTFTSAGERAVLGTHASADFVLSDSAVSRFHCDISVQGGRLLVRDLGSRNGMSVDGVPVQAAYLRSGATLTVGRTQLRCDVDADQVKIALSGRSRFGLMHGTSPAMRAVFSVLERAAEINSTIILEGETGTGKELAAESIHMEGPRSNGPFIVVDCGAIPPDLLESELFGHQRGAFTGAVASRDGAFVAASGGTVFLDEIGELSSDLQPKLLRALERRRVKPVGSNTYVELDVRVIAATNRNIRAEVNARRFRPDLYYRLAVLQVRLPPLRERLDDIPVLAERILEDLGVAEVPGVDFIRSPEFLENLKRHSWPGNVRELRNYIERCIALLHEVPHEDAAADEHEAALIDAAVPLKRARERWTEILERRYLEESLRRHDGNVSAVARTAGVGRVHLYRLLWKHGLR